MTDFLDIFDTESLSETGAWLHFEKPDGSGLAYHKDKPVRVKLKGPDAPEWQLFLREAQKSKDDESPEEERKREARLFASMTISNEVPGFEKGDKNYDMYYKYRDFRRQATTFLLKRRDFFKAAQSA